ncbi:hypothetical protein H0H92_016086 [Tricholoma furcatifolium]|nr:hypothetical protein H0H92_016086 [Tricholoma furcatifolium]
MKLFAPAFAFAAFAAAQRSSIGLPADGAYVAGGSEIIVQVVRPVSIEGSIEVGIVIGLLSCPVTSPYPCPPPSQEVGSVLFNGHFDPEMHEQPGRPYENFTVTIPEGIPGRAQLSVDRFHLIGGGPSPVLEINNITLNVVGPSAV